MSEAAAEIAEPTVDDVLVRRGGRCSKCENPGGYRRSLLCKVHYEALIMRYDFDRRGRARPRGEHQREPAPARKRVRKTRSPKKPLSAEASRRRLAAHIAAEVARQAPEAATRIHKRLGFGAAENPRYREARDLAVAEGWITLENGKGYLPGPNEAPDPNAKPPDSPEVAALRGRAKTRAEASQRGREMGEAAREAEAERIAERIEAYVLEHGAKPMREIAAAVEISPETRPFRRASKLLTERHGGPVGMERARVRDALPGLLTAETQRGADLAAALRVPVTRLREVATELAESGHVAITRRGYALASVPSDPSEPSAAADTSD